MEITAKKYLVMVACALSSVLGAHAQSNDEVKNSKNYVWGEGTGTTREQAEKEALGAMSRQISVNIFNISTQKDANGQGMDESVLQTVSTAMLQNVQIRELSEEPDARVFCFMERKEVEKMYEARAKKIQEFVEAGKLSEGHLQIDDALRNYYWALMLAKTNPKAVTIDFGNKEKGMATALLPIKIRSVMHQLKGTVMEGVQENNRVNALVNFTYNDRPVSSLQFRYHDGQSNVGPVYVKDGVGAIELLGVPANNKVRVTYEYRFPKMVDPLDGDLFGLYAIPRMLTRFDDAVVELPIKVKGKEVSAGKPEKPAKGEGERFMANADGTNTQMIEAQPTRDRKTIEMRHVPQTAQLEKAVQTVENAIRIANPQLARPCFTSEGFELFKRLMNIDKGRVNVAGNKQEHEYVEADGYLLGRSTRIKIKFDSGKSFIENLVYRFNPQSGLIESVAFALTKQAENDIMNASATWPEVSRWAILSFMEDYQTAFALKRTDYISSIFSDDALIITGTVLKKAEDSDQVNDLAGKTVKFNNNNDVTYNQFTKKEYIERLQKIFDKREYVHLTFENNVTKSIAMPSVIQRGAAFGIEIKQRYTSSGYSDVGYLTLVLDTRGQLPIIHVRLWQPDKTEMVSLQEFINKFNESERGN